MLKCTAYKKHIIVCGHHGCGGIQAAMSNKSIGLIDNWVRHIKDVYRMHKTELDKIADIKERHDAFAAINVKEQVLNLAKSSIVQNAWKNNQELHIHGWIYGTETGLIKDLVVNVNSSTNLEELYILNFEN